MISIDRFDPICITYSQMNLIFNSRIYYRRLTTWTRAYLLSTYYGIGTAEELFGRLYLESLDVANMLQIIFGRQYSEEYSQLLSQFAITLRNILEAQKSGNTEDAIEHVNRLFQNTEERAAYLEALNPYWSREEYKGLLGKYAQYVLELANALAAGEFSKDIEIYDKLNAHTNIMGDVFAEGIFDYITSGAQEAGQLTPQEEACITYDQMNTIYDIRMFWFEWVIWVRNYMLSRYQSIGNEQEVFERLKQVPLDYTNSLRRVFGDEVADGLLQELNTFLDLLSQYLTAQKANDIAELDRITRLFYQNADKRAELISSVNPFWTFEEWRNRLYNGLRMIIEQSTSFLTGDYAKNIDIFSRLLDLAENTANYFAEGLFSYIFQQNQELMQSRQPQQPPQ